MVKVEGFVGGLDTIRDHNPCPLRLRLRWVRRNHYTGSVEAAIKRELAFAPYADMIWLETKLPDLAQARGFARKIREKYPGKWFVYNLSPSFNWTAQGFSSKWLALWRWTRANHEF